MDDFSVLALDEWSTSVDDDCAYGGDSHAIPPAAVPENDVLLRVSHELEALAQRVARVAHRPNTDVEVTAPMIRGLLLSRRDRQKYFPEDLFADPAWDILLTLTVAALEKKKLSVSEVCAGSGVPTTTALRWIKLLSDANTISRMTDPYDARRSYLALSAEALSSMMSCLGNIQVRMQEAAR